ncbi:MAG: glycoside hydrolase family 3 protein, partial [Parvibaculales bacterium]
MKYITSIIVSLSLVLVASIASADERKIDALISQMTIEEKVGQMTQINVDLLLKVKDKNKSIYSFNQNALHKAFNIYKVGSILNTPANGSTSQEKWIKLIVDLQQLAMKTRLQIPILYGVDSIHGTNYADEGTIFPHNIGIAASRNIALAAVSARITALETRALGVRWNFDPVFDLGRNPLWSRFPETFGEDPYLTTEMGMANLEAYQGDDMSRPDRVAATAKHFYGYGDPRSGKDRTASYIPESELQNLHLPPFEAAIRRGGIASIMINSGSLNRIPVHADKALLTGLIRDEWGYDGVIVSDWEDIIRLHTRHFIAENEREATRMGVE